MLDLSIIIPLYKGKEFIEETVRSIKEISCSKEIIIIDDGSPDDSLQFCKCKYKNDNEIVVVHKENSGIVDARNFGLAMAEGKYIMFSDQDDISYAKVIEKAVEHGINGDYDVVFWSTVYLLENGETAERDKVFEDRKFNSREIKTILIQDMILNTNNTAISYIGHVWSGIYKRKLLNDNQIKFKRFVDIEDDYLFILDVLNVAKKVKAIKEVGYAWRYNVKSETYRLKYIDNMVERYTMLYDYIGEIIGKLDINEDLMKKFEIYSKQETIIRSLENEFTFLGKSFEQKRKVKNFYKNNKKYFSETNVFKYVKKRKRIYVLLKYNLFEVAAIYIFCDSIWRKLKIKVRHK